MRMIAAWSSLLLSLCLVILPLTSWGGYTRITCRDPDAGGDVQNKDRQFMLLGHDDAGGAGIGNLLIFFPAAYYFSVITSRDIIINDHSLFGELCRIIQCGFPFLSNVRLAFPDILNKKTLAHVDELRAGDFGKYIEKGRSVTAKVVRAGGYISKSDWWVWYNASVHCVKRITGCDLGDVMCAERHAYQRLIRGPFTAQLTANEKERIHGIPDNMKSAILNLPHAYAPRLDAAIHLRTQFFHFEAHSDLNSSEYRREVSQWLNGSECRQVFRAMTKQVIDLVKAIRPNANNSSQRDETTTDGDESRTVDPVYIYLASDNEEVKDELADHMMNNQLLRGIISIMKVETKGVYHAKNLKHLKKASNNEGLLDLVVDWYALSLANNIYAWRKGSTNMLSTFVHSAQKLSGTIDRTDSEKGSGMGTRGLQLVLNRWGGMQFTPFWVYTFLDDFK